MSSDGWLDARLGDVANIVMGQSPPGSTYNERGEGMPFIQGCAEFGLVHPAPVKWCTAPSRVAEPGDILISVRAPVGRLNRADERIAFGRGIAAIRGGEDALTDYVALALASGVDRLHAVSSGSTFAAINKGDLHAFLVPLPPIEVQRRIVDLIAAANANVGAVAAQLTRAEALRDALVADLLSGEHSIPDAYDKVLASNRRSA